MADSVSTEAWLDQRRWAALEEALKAQGSNVKRHLQDYLITLYNETVPLERWVQIETAITKEELESAQAAEDQKVYRPVQAGYFSAAVLGVLPGSDRELVGNLCRDGSRIAPDDG